MDTPEMDKLMDGFAEFASAENVDAERGAQLFLMELFGPTKTVLMGEDGDGKLRVALKQAKPPRELEMSERQEAGLRELGLDPDLVRIAARSRSAEEYAALKVRVEARRR